MPVEYLLVPIAFFTSALAGAIGMGGGVLLITAMPGLVPVAAILPIHACTQLASNLSRASFGWRHIEWRLVPPLALGALLGAWLGSEVYSSLDLFWLPFKATQAHFPWSISLKITNNHTFRFLSCFCSGRRHLFPVDIVRHHKISAIFWFCRC